MRCKGPTFSDDELAQLQEDFSFTPLLDELAADLAVLGQPTRLKIFALLDRCEEMCVCDLAEVLGLSVSAVSQNLARMRAMRMVTYRRDAQTLYYRLTDHPLLGLVRAAVRRAAEEEAR